MYKGKTCEFLHPKFCKKFVKNGYGGRFGCKDSRENCQYFHPTLCRNSVKFKKCLNAKCTFTHLKGTVRKEYETRNFPPISAQDQAQAHDLNFENQNFWQTKHIQRKGAQSLKPQNTFRTYYNSSATDESSFNVLPNLQIQLWI